MYVCNVARREERDTGNEKFTNGDNDCANRLFIKTRLEIITLLGSRNFLPEINHKKSFIICRTIIIERIRNLMILIKFVTKVYSQNKYIHILSYKFIY